MGMHHDTQPLTKEMASFALPVLAPGMLRATLHLVVATGTLLAMPETNLRWRWLQSIPALPLRLATRPMEGGHQKKGETRVRVALKAKTNSYIQTNRFKRRIIHA
jgi:hypothetical protein